jgi:streptogramin lyase
MLKNQSRKNRTGLAAMICVSLGMAYVLNAKLATTQETRTAVIRGTVRSSENANPLHGIAVKARGDGKNYVTSVYTDTNGNYEFPPLPQGKYQISVGTKWKESVQLSASGARQDFAVELGLGFMNQTNAARWGNLVLGNAKTQEEKDVLTSEETTCAGGCHTLWRIFNGAPKSPQGWPAIVNRMNSQDMVGGPRSPERMDNSYVGLGRSPEEVEKISKVLGRSNIPELKEKYIREAIVQPSGEAARTVTTEWDLPHKVEYVNTATVDAEGIIWYVGSVSNTIGRLDPRTNEFREWTYRVPYAHLHDVLLDGRGNLWVTANNAGTVIKFNTKTYSMTDWQLPGRPHTGAVDSQGNYWVTSDHRKSGTFGETGGVAKIDARTGRVTEYLSPSKNPGPYGLVVDRDDNVWYTEQRANNVVKVDGKTGKFTIYPVPSPNANLRRIVTDSKGKIWFVQSNVSKLGMLDPATGKITEYDYGLPRPYTAYAYGIRVDKTDKVWVGLVNTNLWAKFDPETKNFVFYPLPSPESWPRDAWFDYTTSPPSLVWGVFTKPIIGRMYIR